MERYWRQVRIALKKLGYTKTETSFALLFHQGELIGKKGSIIDELPPVRNEEFEKECHIATERF